VIVYDWALRPEDARSCDKRKGLAAASRPAPQDDFPVWVWGRTVDDFRLGVTLAGCKHANAVTSVKLTLFDAADTKTHLGSAVLKPWLGSGFAVLTPNVKAAKLADEPDDLGGEGGVKDLLDDDIVAGDEQDLLVKVELYAGKVVLATKQVKVKTGLDDPSGEYW